jgi:hypothetical protein
MAPPALFVLRTRPPLPKTRLMPTARSGIAGLYRWRFGSVRVDTIERLGPFLRRVGQLGDGGGDGSCGQGC